MEAQDLPSSRLGQSINLNRHRVITKYGPSIIQTISDWVNLCPMAKPDMTQSLWSSKKKKKKIHTFNSAPCKVSTENALWSRREIWDINTDEISNPEAGVNDTSLCVTVSWCHTLKGGMLFTIFFFFEKVSMIRQPEYIKGKGQVGLEKLRVIPAKVLEQDN